MIEKFLFCKPLATTTKTIGVFNIINSFSLKHRLVLIMCSSPCTYGAPAMLGNTGFAALVKKEVPYSTVTHFMLHRHTLAAKSLPDQLKYVLSIVVSAINFILSEANNELPSVQSFL